ncbi:MAG: O-antigen biosynthesis protein WlbG [Bacteroidales bacterium]
MASRRIFDFITSATGLLFLSPLLIVIALAVWISDGRPVLFLQTRIGRNGKPFRIVKFRTMRAEAEQEGFLTVGTDKRITRTGAFLRKYKLDELPQLWNVFLGEMSLVGPRPEVPDFVALYSEEQKKVLSVRPGITDPASLKFVNESEILAGYPDPEKAYREIILPEKLKITLEYMSKATVGSDIAILLQTIARLFGR